MNVGDTYQLRNFSQTITIVKYDDERITYRFITNGHVASWHPRRFHDLYEKVIIPTTLDEELFVL